LPFNFYAKRLRLLNQSLLLPTTSLQFVGVVMQPATDYLCSIKKNEQAFASFVSARYWC